MTISEFFYHFKENKNIKDYEKIVQKAGSSATLINLIEKMAKKGFHFGGDTQSHSKAYTDIHEKVIRIGLDKPVDQIILSLSYELINAENSEEFENIHNQFLSDTHPTTEKSVNYAKAILQVESHAAYNRSKIAIEEDITHLIKNQKYVNFVKEESSYDEATEEIFKEMVINGKVHNGQKSALAHYAEQYFQFIKPPPKPTKRKATDSSLAD